MYRFLRSEEGPAHAEAPGDAGLVSSSPDAPKIPLDAIAEDCYATQYYVK